MLLSADYFMMFLLPVYILYHEVDLLALILMIWMILNTILSLPSVFILLTTALVMTVVVVVMIVMVMLSLLLAVLIVKLPLAPVQVRKPCLWCGLLRPFNKLLPTRHLTRGKCFCLLCW